MQTRTLEKSNDIVDTWFVPCKYHKGGFQINFIPTFHGNLRYSFHRLKIVWEGIPTSVFSLVYSMTISEPSRKKIPHLPLKTSGLQQGIIPHLCPSDSKNSSRNCIYWSCLIIPRIPMGIVFWWSQIGNNVIICMKKCIQESALDHVFGPLGCG